MATKQTTRSRDSTKATAKPRPPISRSDLARLLSVSLPTIDAWRRRGCPVVELASGAVGYRIPEVFEWRLERARELATPRTRNIDLEELKLRRFAAETELAEQALEDARARVVSVDIVVELVDETFDRIRSKLLDFPARYAPKLAKLKTAPEFKRALSDAVREVLEELSSGDAVPNRPRRD